MLSPGDVLDRKLLIGRVLAKEPLCVVYEAKQLALDERVQVKVLDDDHTGPELVARFVRQARNAARIRSEHVARFIDVGECDDGRPYLVMELLEGERLDAFLVREGPLPVADAIDCALQICDALAAAHLVGILHRELSLDKIVRTKRLDGSPLYKVLDFGVSRTLNSVGQREDEGLTVANVRFPFSTHRAPEQNLGLLDLDARTDVFAVGAVLFQLITGSPPYGGDVAPLLPASKVAPPTVRAHRQVPDELDAAIARALEVDRAKRWPAIAPFVSALARFARASSREIARRIAALPTAGGPTVAPPETDVVVEEGTVIGNPFGPEAGPAGPPRRNERHPPSARVPQSPVVATAPISFAHHDDEDSASGASAGPRISRLRSDGTIEPIIPRARVNRRRGRVVALVAVLLSMGVLLGVMFTRWSSRQLPPDPVAIAAAPSVAVTPSPQPSASIEPVPAPSASAPSTQPVPSVAVPPPPPVAPTMTVAKKNASPPPPPATTQGTVKKPPPPSKPPPKTVDPWDWQR